MMKKLLIAGAVALLLGAVMIISAQAQNVTTPRPVSPAAEVKQTIGITDIVVNYSRPKVTSPQGQDRSGNIWGGLVPYGFNTTNFGNGKPIPWRAGANENTVFTVSHDIKVEGKDLAAGTYGLHIEVKENDVATVIFSSNSTSWGSFFYEDSEDVLRVPIKTAEVAHTEVLTYNFIDFDATSTTLALDWEKKRFPIKIEVPVHEIVLANFRNELRSQAGFGWQGPLTAANYCFQNNINTEEALAWVDQSINANRNFQNVFTKARLLNQKGESTEYLKLMDEAAELANIGQLNFMGYQLMGQGKVDKAIEMFELNVKRNPENANVHDSLGEAYRTKGNNKMAEKSFRKSLSLNPPANVKANSERNLKEMGLKI